MCTWRKPERTGNAVESGTPVRRIARRTPRSASSAWGAWGTSGERAEVPAAAAAAAGDARSDFGRAAGVSVHGTACYWMGLPSFSSGYPHTWPPRQVKAEEVAAAAGTPTPAGCPLQHSGKGRGYSLGWGNWGRRLACWAAAGHVRAYCFPGGTSPRCCFHQRLGTAMGAAEEVAAGGCNTLLSPASDVRRLGFDACNSPGVMNLAKKSAGSSAGCHGNHTFHERTAWLGLVICGEKKQKLED